MGVTYLLDTHVLLWLLSQAERIGTDARERLADRSAVLLVSSVSAFEVATKVRLGKLSAPGLLEAWSRRVGDIDAVELPLTTEHALLAGAMSWEHRDSFDRLLVAQAVVESAVLVTADATIGTLPAPQLLMV